MKRLLQTLVVTTVLSSAPSAVLAKPPAASAKPAASSGTPQVGSLATFVDGFQFGVSRSDLTKAVIAPGGVIDKLFDPELRKAAPGVQQRAIETERESVKSSFQRSMMEFTPSSPSGLDAGPMGKEYTYGNHESAMILQTPSRKRYYFFINDKLWKVYDEVVLGSERALGNTFPEIEAKVSTKLGAAPKRASEHGYPQLEWQDSTTHLRLVDRSGERLIGVVAEERATLNNLASLRSAKIADPFAVDPAILAVTKGGLSDPNKQKAEEEAAEAKKNGKKKGKK